MRTLITGAQGFVGRHLDEHLRRSGDTVVGVDRECDVTDLESVTRTIAQCRPEVIYHLAALTDVGASWKESALFTRVNVLGTANVLKATRSVVPDALVLLVSSADVYGVVRERDLPLSETHHPVPVNPYAQSKLEAEQIAFDAIRSQQQRVIIARPFNHVGPGQSVDFAVAALVSRLLDARDRGQREIRVGNLASRRDFSDVRDVVRAYRMLVQYGQSGEIYNVASGVDVGLLDVATELVDLIAPGVQLVRDPELFRPVEVPVMRGSAAKLHDLTGWEPSFTLGESLRDVIDDFEQRRAAPLR